MILKYYQSLGAPDISSWLSIISMMDKDTSKIIELDQEMAEALAQRARRTTYYTHLTEFLSENMGEQVPQENIRAFEREDGVHVVGINDSTDCDSLPQIGITFIFEEEKVIQATAEVNDLDASGTQKIIHVNEFIPNPDEVPEEIPLPNDDSADVKIRNFEDVTVYEIDHQ